ncbi:hypothetical protein [Marinobacterium marinum]|uniref:Uncharacterized protein n=1 Tax=Marinobacterium marinum TaxID=2756129 RepID=A0A7W1WX19_9GAMM|nr:hypothetical protein [Marinobacterium marinum]MBA4501694.1 hypothetical protein [Marinobacterium marinum]
MNTVDAFGIKEQMFEDMLHDYDEAKQWLEELGIKIEAGRFQSYKKLIAQSLKRGKFNSPDINDSDALWAVAELHDLLEISKYLHGVDHEDIKNTLNWLKKGPPLLSGEPNDGGGIHGRNFTFELYASSRFLRAGLDVSYQSDADLNIFIANTLLHVECKRAVTENNLEGLIEKAIEQIDRSCEENDTDRGLIALSLSKLFWMIQVDMNQGNVADEKELQSLLHPVSEKIAMAIRAQYATKSDNVIGVIFHYKMPFYRRSNGFPAFINRFSFVSFSDPGTTNKAISDELSNCLKQSVYSSG